MMIIRKRERGDKSLSESPVSPRNLLLLSCFSHLGLDSIFNDFDAGVFGDFDNEAVFFDVGDDTVDAACGDDVIACRECFEHFCLLFLSFALRSDEEEPHGAEKENHDD